MGQPITVISRELIGVQEVGTGATLHPRVLYIHIILSQVMMSTIMTPLASFTS
jgi:hypothetical protein